MKLDFLIFRAFRDKRFQVIRNLLDSLASREDSRLPSITRGAGEAGVTAWRVQQTSVWERIMRKKKHGLLYPTMLTDSANTVYERLSKKKEHFPEVMPVEFEAWAIIIYKVTFETPHSSYTERNCGSTVAELAISVVQKQRDMIAVASGAADSD